MIRFCLAASTVYAIPALWAILFGGDALGRQSHLMLSVILSSWLAPTMATWLAAEAMHMLAPRRLLHRRLSMPTRRLFLGGITGTLGCILGVLAMAGLDRFGVPDVALTSAAAAIAAIAVITPTTRIRKGECLFCRYSLAGATPASKGVCAECGSDVMTA
jgi:hypothetical protein